MQPTATGLRKIADLSASWRVRAMGRSGRKSETPQAIFGDAEPIVVQGSKKKAARKESIDTKVLRPHLGGGKDQLSPGALLADVADCDLPARLQPVAIPKVIEICDPGPLVAILYIATDLRTAGPFTGRDNEWLPAASFPFASGIAFRRLTSRLWADLEPQLAKLWVKHRGDPDASRRLLDLVGPIVDFVRAAGWPIESERDP